MFLPVEKVTLITIAIGVNTDTFAVKLTLAKFAFAAIAIGKNINTFPTHLTLDKNTFIAIAIRKLPDTLTIKFSILERALITSPFFKS